MFEVIKTSQGVAVRHDLHALQIDGYEAHKLDSSVLFRKLTKLGVPGVSVNEAKQDMLIRYSEWLLARGHRRPNEPQVFTPPVIPDERIPVPTREAPKAATPSKKGA
jgi:hypothetical protein